MHEVKIDQLHAIAARGGLLKPVPGGVYKVNQTMINDLSAGRYGTHASNLGAMVASSLSKQFNVNSYIVDPVTTDDFPPIARISGVPGIERKSRSHALNIKYCFRKACSQLEKDPKTTSMIVCHLGGGFSIAVVQGGKIIDVNDALLGMGPFSIERAGAMPIAGLLSLAYQNEYSKKEIEKFLSKQCGLKGYLGTNDFKLIEKQILKRDSKTVSIFEAMVYQIVKEIGSGYGVLNGNCDGVIFTGGLSHSPILQTKLKEKLEFIKPIFIYPGSFELEALCDGVLQVLNNQEKPKHYS